MPPKAKITREMILDAAFAIARASGFEHINARTVSQRMNCSTQPVMYHFPTIEALKRAVYERADAFHSAYLMTPQNPQQDAMLSMGLNYIRFAIEEPHLFRLLFQSGYATEHSLLEMVDSEQLTPILAAMQTALTMNPEETKAVFVTIALFAHGYASIIANNGLEFDESTIARHLERAFHGAILAVEEERK